MLYFALGMIAGFIFAVFCFSRLVIGKLARAQDEEGLYPYMVLNKPNIHDIFKKKFVVLEVDNSHE